MDKKIYFILGFHLHQPVGNFQSVFELAYKNSYAPLIDAFSRHSQIPFSIHISGPLWEDFMQNRKEIIEKLKVMVSNGQAELISAGFYEPILIAISREDALGQIKMMKDFLFEEFSAKSEGLWLTERVWEPQLPSIIKDAGIKYVIVDDYHIKSVGIVPPQILGYFCTEDNGNKVAVFPISEILRYSMPFAEVERTFEYLRYVRDTAPGSLIVFADDGEKFGLWPGTKKWVWDEGWMEKFLTTLESNLDWVEPMTFSDALKRLKPRGNVYMPTTSYFQMSEWTLPAQLSFQFHQLVKKLKDEGSFEELQPFIKGGFWRNFFTKYPESNWFHKRMLWVSNKIRRHKRSLGKKFEDATKAIYRSQCNCAYWHGVFGGLYLTHLREAVWKNMLEAEALVLPKAKIKPILIEDIDCDGTDEIRLSNDELAIWIAPSRGGSIEEISFFPANVNITNTLSRHAEGYHKLISFSRKKDDDTHKSIHDVILTKEDELDKFLHIDWYIRRFAHDHFIFVETTPAQFERMEYTELGDFVNQPYRIVEALKDENGVRVKMQRDGNLWHQGRNFPVLLDKTISLSGPGNRLEVEYEITNKGAWRQFAFAVETHFSLLSRNDSDRTILVPKKEFLPILAGDRTDNYDIDGYEIKDKTRNIRISFRSHNKHTLWTFPIETISSSEEGFERIYQETAIAHIFYFTLNQNEATRFSLMWRFELIEENL